MPKTSKGNYSKVSSTGIKRTSQNNSQIISKPKKHLQKLFIKDLLLKNIKAFRNNFFTEGIGTVDIDEVLKRLFDEIHSYPTATELNQILDIINDLAKENGWYFNPSSRGVFYARLNRAFLKIPITKEIESKFDYIRPVEVVMKNLICPKCQHKNYDNNVYCSKCGYDFIR